MSETKELIVGQPKDVVANTVADLPSLQAPLLPWADKKLADSQAEYAELLNLLPAVMDAQPTILKEMEREP